MAIRRALAALGLVLATVATAHAGEIRVMPINDHVFAFYDGRPAESSVNMAKATWADHGANFVGVATYAVIDGSEALVYDTYPSVTQAQFVRDYLAKRGVRHFIVANSHWHLDHVGGNAVYADSSVIATEKTRAQLIRHKPKIKDGTLQGPPAISPFKVPEVGITEPTTVSVGRYSVELRPVNIHSADGLVAWLPQDRLLLAGDTLEDTLTFIAEPESLAEQYRNLGEMKSWSPTGILPNHGDPAIIAKGGYTTALIDMTRHYIRAMAEHAHDKDFAIQPIERFIPAELKAGTVSLWWAYREAHHENLQKLATYYKNKPLSDFGP
ncbi:MBL fold metallo-hydrolase [Novosphingobium taihuense]|uniref:Glyoxylase-like metal-dependent hydrolase (Beta-lactamase superfamily II) n=1 Tax=Novosphingobium taihuense TaxID=260085 RepID=A0A7W7EUK0_9SPHN|nr:MBL fold metallo-hydrolase [Novosphingobium taihuense]MBB4612410.1 glyoxylase-like metal-dependent hydrolase (beta-lactamase superfamily II) [Novosphingobium taihuense]TWH88238.1 glyoxylase-like metal-dependent hydrolase (beta-lactamase superfamily II) [Novosphingobium taihuense]